MADLRTSSLGGVPKGITTDRPAVPSVGDVFYNGTLGCLEIYTEDGWYAASAPMAIPTIGTATDIGTGRSYSSTGGAATVEFTQNSGGGLPNTFTATSNPGNITAQSSSSPITVSGLNPGTAYTFSVVGTNNFGTSAATASSNSITASSVPQAPTIGSTSTSLSSTDVTVNWTLNSNGGKTLTEITITPYLNGTTAQTPQTAATISSTSHAFTGLTPGSSYTFKVKATNENGTSLESSASSSTTVPNIVLVQYLVIAGGGAGGTDGATGAGGGGAGAGGYRSNVTGESSGGGASAEIALGLTKNTPYTITVGAGGATNAIGSSSLPSKGGNSVLGSITSLGGGYGSAYTSQLNYWAAGTGGSGGGGNGYRGSSGTATVGAAGTSGQGYRGGNGTDQGPYAGPGGGGAGAVGADSTATLGGNGGIGVASSITGTSVYRAGGGGGAQGNTNTGSVGAGGNGGGGAGGAYNGNSVAGTANTGGGAGGGNANPNLLGANGGSGVIIIKIPNTNTASFSGGVTQTMSTAVSGYKVYTVTAAGVSDTVTIS